MAAKDGEGCENAGGGIMADLTIKAVYATVAEDDEERFAGFVGKHDETYALFRQPRAGGPVSFELNDPDFCETDAIESLTRTATGILVTLRPGMRSRYGFVGVVAIRCDRCEDAEAGLQAVARMGWPGIVGGAA
jgi:hypothetical protein